ncbi:MAG: hypothetical protein IPG86_04700 [Chitinophagaceae bacterium]|nr:hypothetical protein [Chitinophagaceae bacterium]
MKAIILLLCLFCQFSIMAQREKAWGDPHVIEKFTAEAKKNPSYTQLHQQIAELSRAANGRQTNAAAVRALLIKNSALLRNIYSKAGLDAPQTMSAKKKQFVVNPNVYSKAILWNKYKLANSEFQKTFTPPYSNDRLMTNEAGVYIRTPDTSQSQFNTGTVKMKYETVPANSSSFRTGQHLQGYIQKIIVPENPEIVAAEITLNYSYLYTGWDSFGAILGMDIALNASSEFTGPDYAALPIYVSPNGENPNNTNHRWKLVSTLLPTDTINSDFEEFHIENSNESFTIRGYVTPGKMIDLSFVMGFQLYAKRGINGSYHYAEFIVKKITVNYFKAAGNN